MLLGVGFVQLVVIIEALVGGAESVYVCVYMYVHVHACVQMCVEAKWYRSSGAVCLVFFFDSESVTGLELTSGLGWPASEPWGLPCPHFPSTGLTHTTVLFSPAGDSGH